MAAYSFSRSPEHVKTSGLSERVFDNLPDPLLYTDPFGLSRQRSLVVP